MSKSEWFNKYHSSNMVPRAAEAIHRRRRQMLVHSCIYYELNSNIIDDNRWTLWAQQLLRLQQKYGWRIGFYDKVFKTWDGSTGHHLPHRDPGVLASATRLLDAYNNGLDLLA